MLTISLQFPTGRYHATPWSRHVNEAVPEWPPSPYRLVRALFDVWKRKLPHWPPERVEPLLQQLSNQPPHFHLPPAGASHTRSYLHRNTFTPTDKTLIFDGFVVLNPESAVKLHWPSAELSPPERNDLETMLRLLNFFGRSESWVIAGLAATSGDWNCLPAAAEADTGGDYLDVACPLPKSQFTPPKRKGDPKSWLDALTYSTTDLLKDKASQPPALQLVPYLRPFGALEPPRARSGPRRANPVHAVLYSLSGPVLPRLAKAIEVGEQVRKQLMGIHRKNTGNPAAVSSKFSGHHPGGAALQGHRHCYVLPYSTRQDGFVDRILVWSQCGFDQGERIALASLTTVGWVEPKPRAVAVALGDSGRLRPRATTVESRTPFVPPRHYRQGRGEFTAWLKAQVCLECANHGLPEPVAVEIMERPASRGAWREFRRNRKGEAPRFGCGFRLRFAEPVHAPFSLGYGSHFGLGQFHAPSTG